ncbi:hypothetical protein VNO77_13494 [Canavalia gladiata]|uniref:Uncharacterized protein n=1 Tax=Canavalia gladiata TaxID=3824 RepID=A0AAN9QNC6_CANGL
MRCMIYGYAIRNTYMPQTCISLLSPHKRCFWYPSNSQSSSPLLTLLPLIPIFSTSPPIFLNLFSNSSSFSLNPQNPFDPHLNALNPRRRALPTSPFMFLPDPITMVSYPLGKS